MGVHLPSLLCVRKHIPGVIGDCAELVQFWNVYLRISSVIFGEKSKEELINAIAR